MNGAGCDISKFQADISRITAAVRAGAEKGLTQFGLMILGRAQRLAPVGGGIYSPRDPAPGTLKGSATWEGPHWSGNIISMEIGFNTVYAAVQHERLDYRHDQGQAKYLEQPMREAEPKFAEHMKEAMGV